MVPKHAESGYHSPAATPQEVRIGHPAAEDFEPADKPVWLYETALCLAAQLLALTALSTHYHPVALAAAASLAVLIALSLWKLVVPPRLSVTRCAFILVGLLYLFLLWHP